MKCLIITNDQTKYRDKGITSKVSCEIDFTDTFDFNTTVDMEYSLLVVDMGNEYSKNMIKTRSSFMPIIVALDMADPESAGLTMSFDKYGIEDTIQIPVDINVLASKINRFVLKSTHAETKRLDDKTVSRIQYQLDICRRAKKPLTLALIKIKDNVGESTLDDFLKLLIDKTKTSDYLRSTDIFFKFNSATILASLFCCDEQGVDTVMEKIQNLTEHELLYAVKTLNFETGVDNLKRSEEILSNLHDKFSITVKAATRGLKVINQ